MYSPLLPGCTFLVLATLRAAADYQDDAGFTRLKAELGAALPNGAGISMSHVEALLPSPPFAANAWLPQAGSGTFAGSGLYAGKQFTAKSGSGAFSFHANEVAGFMYGDDTGFNTIYHSMCAGVVTVDCYNADDWVNNVLSPTASNIEPLVESRDVQNHSWITNATASNASAVNDVVRRQDFSINRDNYVCCVGLDNGSTTVVPDIWASSYNAISVGVSSGAHSRGGVTADMDGPARRKPEMVAPLEATSHATGYVSSAAGLLLAKANVINTNNARHAKTIKAVLLAGATKEEFPGWAKTATDPIDAIYGAGELNIYNSYHILDGGEQAVNAAGDATGRAYFGWDMNSIIGSATADYRLNIPAGTYGVELSAFIVWHRTLTDPVGGGFTLGNDTLVNYNLTLFRDPAAGGTAVTIDSSTSTIYNLEHVWKKDLPAGTYRLRVSRTSGATQEYSIAWRLSTAPHQPQPLMVTAGSNYNFTFPGLLIGQPYKFQSSPDLVTWTDIESFTASTTSTTRVLARPATPRLLYRLLPVLP